MRNSSNLAITLILATILALGVTCAWIVIMFFPTALVSPWLPNFLESQLWLIDAALLSPLMVSIALFIYTPLKYTGRPLQVLEHSYVFLPILLLVAIAFALAIRTYFRHKRISESGALAWAIFVLLWGMPGFIGYLAHCRWPIIERCSSCGADTPRDRDDCLHCHAPFPPPAQTGTEIFA